MEAFAKLGLDAWGIVLYLGNFGVLLLVLHRFVYKPLIGVVDARRQQIKEDVEEAEALRAKLQDAELRALEEGKEQEARMQARFTEAKRVVKEEAAAVLADAEARREALLTQASAQAQQQLQNILSQAEGETKRRIERVVVHVLKETVSEETVRGSVEESWNVIEQTAYGK